MRLVHTGQVVHTIRMSVGLKELMCMTLVPGHSELLVTAHRNGAVHLWDIVDKGALACECMNANAGVHVRQIGRLGIEIGLNDKIVASSTRFMCSYDYNKKMAIVHFDDEKSLLF